MSALHKNFIGGEWVEGAGVTRDINPSDTNDVVGEYAQADAAQTDAAIEAAHAAFPAWARTTPQERHDILLRASIEILARRDELGRLLAREEGKTLPEAIGEVARAGADLRFLRRRSVENTGREVRLGQTRRRHRGDARAGRRRGHHRAVEFSHRHSGLEDRARARLWQCGRVQAGRPRSRLRPRARRDHRSRGRPQGRVQPRHGPRLGGRPGDPRPQAASTQSLSPARLRPADGSPPPAPARCASSSWKWAARIRSIVLADADLQNAVECAVNGAYFSTGQRCTASSRIIVEEPVYKRFADALIERMRGLVVDDALKAGNPYRTGGRRETSSNRISPISRSARARAPNSRSAANC